MLEKVLELQQQQQQQQLQQELQQLQQLWKLKTEMLEFLRRYVLIVTLSMGRQAPA